MRCKLCNKKAVIGKGWFNFADIMYPFCEDHKKEYEEFKQKAMQE